MEISRPDIEFCHTWSCGKSWYRPQESFRNLFLFFLPANILIWADLNEFFYIYFRYFVIIYAYSYKIHLQNLKRLLSAIVRLCQFLWILAGFILQVWVFARFFWSLFYSYAIILQIFKGLRLAIVKLCQFWWILVGFILQIWIFAWFFYLFFTAVLQNDDTRMNFDQFDQKQNLSQNRSTLVHTCRLWQHNTHATSRKACKKESQASQAFRFYWYWFTGRQGAWYRPCQCRTWQWHGFGWIRTWRAGK